MKKSEKINFVSNATTREAFVYSILYSCVFLRNIGRGIDKAAHRLPWVFVSATTAASVIVSIVLIGRARAERDAYNKQLVHTTQQLESYKAAYDGGKEGMQP